MYVLFDASKRADIYTDSNGQNCPPVSIFMLDERTRLGLMNTEDDG